MSDDNCEHVWGDAEMCETRLGNISSPTCRHCGAVKVLEEIRRTPQPPAQQVIPSTSRNWPEDFGQENGNHLGTCIHCREDFVGHKRRTVCRRCTTPFDAVVEDSGPAVRTNAPPAGVRTHDAQLSFFTDL